MNLAQIIEDALTQSGGNDVFVYRLDGVVVDAEIGYNTMNAAAASVCVSTW